MDKERIHSHPNVPLDLIPGSTENLTKLKTYLENWKCCGSPNLCSVACQDSELTDTLARAYRLVTEELNKST